jgi:hypothetical protein
MAITTGPNPPEQMQDSDLSAQQLQPQSITQADQAWMPASTAPAAPASAPAAAPRPVAVGPGTPPITASSPNVKTHSFVARAASGLLTALAGEPGPVYHVDDSGRMVASPAPPMTTGRKLRKIIGTIGVGLSATDPGPQKSGLATLLANVGAGFGAEQKVLTEADRAAEQKARADWEAEQQAMLHKGELAKANATTYSIFSHMHQTQIDRNEEYRLGSDLAKAAEDENIPVDRLTGNQLYQRFKENPQQLLTEGKVVATGEREMSTSDGKPIIDPQTQQPRYERTYAVINGLHDGKLAAPASFIDAVRKYAPYATATKIGSLDGLAEGQELDLKQLARLHNASLEGQKAVLQGWAKPDAVETKDKDGQIQILERNPISGETRPATDEQKNAYQMNKAKLAAEQSIAPKNKAEQDKAEADAQKAKKDAAAGPVSNLTGEDYLRALPTARRGTVQAVGEGRQILPANRKEALALLDDVHQAYPDYDEGLGKTWLKTRNEYMGSGKTATVVVPAYNTALEHMQDLYSNTTKDGIFNPLSKAYQDREVALGYVAREVGKAVSAGALTQKESEDLLSTLKGGLTPSLKRERITKTAQLLHDKIDEYQTKFNAAAPSSAVKVPILISPKAAASYDFVTGKTQASSSQSGPTNVPAGATGKAKGSDGLWHYHDAKGNDLGVAQ